jgi:hypothetical protein
VVHGRRTELVVAGWIVAGTGLLAATLVSRVSVTPVTGGQASAGWPGVAVALAALGLLLASAPAAQRLAEIVANSGAADSTGGQPAAKPRRSAGHGGSVRLAACAALLAAASAPLLVAAYWVKDGVPGPVGSITGPVLPAFVAAASTSGQQYRTLILRPDHGGLASGGLDYMVVRQGDPALGDPELGSDSAAEAALSRQVAALGAPDEADAGDPGMYLGEFGIRWVLLPGPVSPVLAQRLDAAIGLVALSKAPTYDLWQVTGPVARVRAIAPDGTVTALSSSALNEGVISVPAAGGTLVLAEPYGGWTAKLNGRALKPLASPVNGWAQGFVLPPGGGRLSVTHDDMARELSLFLELVALLAVCLLALPGKRADPAEEAEALAALREARNGRRAASVRRVVRPVVLRGAGLRGAGRRAAADADQSAVPRGAERRAATDADRLAVPHGAGHEAAADADQPGVPRGAGHRAAADADRPAVPRGAGHRAATGADRPVAGRRRRPGQPPVPVADPGAREPGVKERKTEVVPGRVPDERVRDQPVSVPDRPDGGTRDAPWDMAGEWGRAPRAPRATATDAWAAPLGDARGTRPQEEGRQRNARSRPTGQQPSVRETAVPGAEPPETRAPWETGPQPAPWESGPQPPVTPSGTPPVTPPGTRSTGAQPRSEWETGPQSRSAWDTGPQSKSAWETGPQSQSAWGTGPQSTVSSSGIRATGAQLSYPWETDPQRPATPPVGIQPVPRTGAQPVARTGAQPVTQAGEEPVPLPPWESGEWPALPGDPSAAAGRRDAVPEPGTGSGPWPIAAPASSRPERHSHRAAKHGRPSRWRGAGKRSGVDGES